MRDKVEKALNDIRPSLQVDGGDVELVDVENGIVKVRLTGACGGCPMSQMTLKQGIESHVKKAVPEVLSVEAVLARTISYFAIWASISIDDKKNRWRGGDRMPMDMQDASDVCCCSWNLLPRLGNGHRKGKLRRL
jgi:Fe-S cluster biogenesis protein NfuA